MAKTASGFCTQHLSSDQMTIDLRPSAVRGPTEMPWATANRHPSWSCSSAAAYKLSRHPSRPRVLHRFPFRLQRRRRFPAPDVPMSIGDPAVAAAVDVTVRCFRTSDVKIEKTSLEVPHSVTRWRRQAPWKGHDIENRRKGLALDDEPMVLRLPRWPVPRNSPG